MAKEYRCKKGYKVSSETGAKYCPKCKFRNSRDKRCILAQTASKVLIQVNKILK